MTSFHCLQVSFIRSCGKYSPSNFDVKNIDLYNIISLRNIDVITSSVCIVNIDVFVLEDSGSAENKEILLFSHDKLSLASILRLLHQVTKEMLV